MERQLSKAFADIQLWKTRYETEGVARCEEIDKVHFATVLASCLNSKSSYFGAKSLEKRKRGESIPEVEFKQQNFSLRNSKLCPEQQLRLTSALIISFNAYFRNPMFKLLYLMKNYICCNLKHLFLKLFWSSWLTLQGFL